MSLVNVNGIWFSSEQTEINYPKEGNEVVFTAENRSYWFRWRNTIIFNSLKNIPRNSLGNAMLDIGGGNGFVAKKFQESGYQVSLVEPGNGIFNAQRRGIPNLYCCSIQALPHHLKFPLVGMFDVIEHIQEPISFLKATHDLIEEYGHLILTVPAYNFLWSEEDDYAGHCRRYTLSTLKNELTSAGFQIHYSTYFFTSLIPLIYFARALPTFFKKRFWPDRKRKDEIPGLVASPLVDLIVSFILRIEVAIMRFFGRLPVGASLLIVATKVQTTND